MMIYSECKLEEELKKITEVFLANGYPKSVMLSNIKFTILKFHNRKIFNPLKCSVYIKIPWIRSCS